jgi:hypothetical protein
LSARVKGSRDVGDIDGIVHALGEGFAQVGGFAAVLCAEQFLDVTISLPLEALVHTSFPPVLARVRLDKLEAVRFRHQICVLRAATKKLVRHKLFVHTWRSGGGMGTADAEAVKVIKAAVRSIVSERKSMR